MYDRSGNDPDIYGPGRIPTILDALGKCWTAHPDYSFRQILNIVMDVKAQAGDDIDLLESIQRHTPKTSDDEMNMCSSACSEMHTFTDECALGVGVKTRHIEEDAVDHPAHYGGDTVYEVIKVIEAWQPGFHLGNAIKCIARAGKKSVESEIEDLEKAAWYVNRRIALLRGQNDG